MKGLRKAYRFLLVLLVGAGVALSLGAASSLALPGAPGQGRSEENHGQAKKHEREREKENHGRREARRHENRGLHRGWERNGKGYYRFDTRDRDAAVRYYREHRNARWARQRLPRGYALREGEVIARRYRTYCHPLPTMLVREMPPPPTGFHYSLVGGSVVLLDHAFRVHDFIHIGINIGN